MSFIQSLVNGRTAASAATLLACTSLVAAQSYSNATTNSNVSPASSVAGWEYVGCFPSAGIETTGTSSYSANSLESCTALCGTSSFKYAAMSDESCVCTNYVDTENPSAETACDMACPGGSGACGGSPSKKRYSSSSTPSYSVYVSNSDILYSGNYGNVSGIGNVVGNNIIIAPTFQWMTFYPTTTYVSVCPTGYTTCTKSMTTTLSIIETECGCLNTKTATIPMTTSVVECHSCERNVSTVTITCPVENPATTTTTVCPTCPPVTTLTSTICPPTTTVCPTCTVEPTPCETCVVETEAPCPTCTVEVTPCETCVVETEVPCPTCTVEVTPCSTCVVETETPCPTCTVEATPCSTCAVETETVCETCTIETATACSTCVVETETPCPTCVAVTTGASSCSGTGCITPPGPAPSFSGALRTSADGMVAWVMGVMAFGAVAMAL